ncbi:MAG: AbrB/MazE/SpoVT family DNA-binding domain-containing protein [Candidatus Thermoplasmatota archaeon]|nr:AbrB/MazE/SpoVT family DNA-binding domain-containing protein [Candidatus Thermoplasmatota archaeon]
METVTVSPKYQVVIPEPIRKRIDIHPGEKVVVFEKNGIIHIVRVGDIREMKGRYKGLLKEGIRDEEDRY